MVENLTKLNVLRSFINLADIYKWSEVSKIKRVLLVRKGEFTYEMVGGIDYRLVAEVLFKKDWFI